MCAARLGAMLAVMSAGNLIAQPATPVVDVVGSDVVTDEVGASFTGSSQSVLEVASQIFYLFVSNFLSQCPCRRPSVTAEKW